MLTINMQSQTCWDCEHEKTLNRFHISLRERFWRKKQCKACSIRAGVRWSKANPEKRRAQNMRQLYGLSLAQIELMKAMQGFTCVVPGCDVRCGLVPDHDHTTGRVLGLMCHGHNIALGFIESTESLRSAWLDTYLKHDFDGRML